MTAANFQLLLFTGFCLFTCLHSVQALIQYGQRQEWVPQLCSGGSDYLLTHSLERFGGQNGAFFMFPPIFLELFQHMQSHNYICTVNLCVSLNKYLLLCVCVSLNKYLLLCVCVSLNKYLLLCVCVSLNKYLLLCVCVSLNKYLLLCVCV